MVREGQGQELGFRKRGGLFSCLAMGLPLVPGITLATGGVPPRADVTLAPLFADHAVLQREKPVRIWGRAAPGERVTVRFGGATAAAVADSNGRWIAELPAMPADAAGRELVVSGRNTLRVRDVVVGELWLCSGQSNMEFRMFDPTGNVYHVKNAAAEAAEAHFPLIRQFAVERQISETPADSVHGSWTPCDPQSVRQFTAVGYFFSREIFRQLGVPIGIINDAWGGTPVESWMSKEALASNPVFAAVGERWQRAVVDYPAKKAEYDAAKERWDRDEAAAAAAAEARHAAFLKQDPMPWPPGGPGSEYTPTVLFNGMIHPILPFAIRGVLWYQGESNTDRPAEYHALFAAMIRSWRARFAQGDIPFFWVQLANFNDPNDATGQGWAFLREAQSRTLSLPETGQAVAIDIGDPDDIHPKNKQEVGRRLALIAMAKAYGMAVDYSGPVFDGVAVEGDAMRVRFRFAEKGLIASHTPLRSFELAGADRIFRPASAVISGDTVVVQSPDVPAPVTVRYAWRDAPEADLSNGSGLPAAPFRSHAW